MTNLNIHGNIAKNTIRRIVITDVIDASAHNAQVDSNFPISNNQILKRYFACS